jgi:hypothetical protein
MTGILKQTHRILQVKGSRKQPRPCALIQLLAAQQARRVPPVSARGLDQGVAEVGQSPALVVPNGK